MEINFKPFHDIVLIKRAKQGTTSAGGIFLPGGQKQSSRTGTVLAVGKGRYCDNTGVFVETTVKPGDEVVFGERAGHEVKLKDISEDEDLVVMREVEVIGVFTKNSTDETSQS